MTQAAEPAASGNAVCMHCMHAHSHARTLARTHARTHASTHARSHARTHARTLARSHRELSGHEGLGHAPEQWEQQAAEDSPARAASLDRLQTQRSARCNSAESTKAKVCRSRSVQPVSAAGQCSSQCSRRCSSQCSSQCGSHCCSHYRSPAWIAGRRNGQTQRS